MMRWMQPSVFTAARILAAGILASWSSVSAQPTGSAQPKNTAQSGSSAPQANPAPRADLAARQRALGKTRPVATAESSAEVPAGTVSVTVVGPNDQPLPNANVMLGVMHQDGRRENRSGTTGELGTHSFSSLTTGSAQSYRAKVLHNGATYASTPFRLEVDRGHRVTIRRLPTTRNQNAVLQVLGQTMLEFREDRLHVMQQAQLMNPTESTYVFPKTGARIDLPAGFSAFQSQPVMTDQRLTATDDGFSLSGSLPPGRATLTWAFDLPLDGGELQFAQPVPWRTMGYRVIAASSSGMRLDVAGFPSPEIRESGGRRFFVTEIRKTPQQPPLDRLSVSLSGIPGPGPLRFVALGAALVLIALGAMLAWSGGDRKAALERARTQRKAELLARAAELKKLYLAQEIGPNYWQRNIDEIVDELASLLRSEEASASTETSA